MCSQARLDSCEERFLSLDARETILFVFHSGINSTPAFPTSTRCAACFSRNNTNFGQNVAPTLDDKGQKILLLSPTVRFK